MMKGGSILALGILVTVACLTSQRTCTAAAVAMAALVRSCPLPPTQEDFQLGKYMGNWYEIAKFPGIQEEQYEKCIVENLHILADGTISVRHEAVDNITLEKKQVNGHAVIPDPKNPAKMEFIMDTVPTGIHHWVIASDYDSYSLVYSCTYQSGSVVERCQVYSRTQTMSEAATNKVMAVMMAYGIDPSRLERTDQTNCSFPKRKSRCRN